MKVSLVGSTALVTNTYGTNNGLLLKSAYANGDAICYDYNNSGLVKSIYQDNNATSANPAFSWEYSSNGTPLFHADFVIGYRYNYNYDSIGRLIRTNISDGALSYIGSTEYGYDIRNNLTSIANDIGGVSYTQLYSYGATSATGSAENAKDNLPTKYAVLGVGTDYLYNNLNQLTERNVVASGNTITNAYTYKMNGSYYTNQLASENIEGTVYSYGYDDVGNITNITKAGANYRAYEYDGLNRLKKETLNNSTVNTWDYDLLGNITAKTTTSGSTKTGIDYVYGTSPNCGWENLLTSVKFVVYNTDGSKTVTKQENVYYDAIGNPYSYRGAIMGWLGRQMITYSKNGVSASFTHDADGLRSSKTVNGSKTEYQYVGDKLFYEKRGNGNSFYYFYDSYGKLSAIYHHVNGTKVAYHVVTNAQGDVVALYNWSGTKVAEYSYDAWGNCTIVSDTTSTHIATLNPFRYRSYYWDTDLGLYYLQSRYYDSEIGRFINADNQISPTDITGLNLFSYCGNNPVNRVDPTGHAWYHWAIGAAIVAACAVATVVTCGGFAAAVTAVGMVGSGIAATTTASTIAAGAFIGSATVYGMAVLTAAGTSNSVEEFNDQGNWGTVAATALGGLTGGYDGYSMSKAQTPTATDISRGSTGRTEPINLNEQLAMEQVRSNPSAGTPITSITLNDPRWPSSEGWVKMQQIVPTSHGDINIHYVYNQSMELYDDFKFCP